MLEAVDMQGYLLAYNLPMLTLFMHRASTHACIWHCIAQFEHQHAVSD